MMCNATFLLLLHTIARIWLTDAVRPEVTEDDYSSEGPQPLSWDLLATNASLKHESERHALVQIRSKGRVCDFINSIKAKIAKRKASLKRFLDIMNVGAIVGKLQKLVFLAMPAADLVAKPDGAVNAVFFVEGSMGIAGLSVSLFVNVFKYLSEKCAAPSEQNACVKEVSGTLVVLSLFSLIFFVVPAFCSTLALTVMNPPAALALSLAISLVSNFVRLYGKSLCDKLAAGFKNPVELALDTVTEGAFLAEDEDFTQRVAAEFAPKTHQGLNVTEARQWLNTAGSTNKQKLQTALADLKQNAFQGGGVLTNLLLKLSSPLRALVSWLTRKKYEPVAGPSVNDGFSVEEILGIHQPEKPDCSMSLTVMEKDEKQLEKELNEYHSFISELLPQVKQEYEEAVKDNKNKEAAAAKNVEFSFHEQSQNRLRALLQKRQQIAKCELDRIGMPKEEQVTALANEVEATDALDDTK